MEITKFSKDNYPNQNNHLNNYLTKSSTFVDNLSRGFKIIKLSDFYFFVENDKNLCLENILFVLKKRFPQIYNNKILHKEILSFLINPLEKLNFSESPFPFTQVEMKKLNYLNFSQIRELNLKGKKLGQGFDYLKEFRNLEILDLSLTDFFNNDENNDEVIKYLSEMNNLIELNLSENQITLEKLKTFFSLNLSNIKKLNLSGCLIGENDGSDYLMKCNLKNLEYLNLQNNSLSEYDMSKILKNKFPKLIELNLKENLIQSLEDLDFNLSMPNLIFLKLKNIQGNYQNLPNGLEKLKINSLNFNEEDKLVVNNKKFKNLKFISLNYQKLQNKFLDEFFYKEDLNFSNLNKLKIDFYDYTTLDFCEALNEGKLKNLENLSIFRKINVHDDFDLKFLIESNFEKLKKLKIRWQSLENFQTNHLFKSKLPNLQILDLEGNIINYEMMAKWSGLQNLEVLNLNNTELKQKGIENLVKVKFNNLKNLSLGNNILTSKGIEVFSKIEFPQLSHLHLNSTKCDDLGIQHLMKSKIPNLKELILSKNTITNDGAILIIKSLDIFKKLVKVDLRSNSSISLLNNNNHLENILDFYLFE